MATTRVAASRAAAGRLAGDRRAANPVPSIVDDVTPPRRSRPTAPDPVPVAADAFAEAGPVLEPLGPPDFMTRPSAAPASPPPMPAPPDPPVSVADDDHFENVGGPPDPAGLLAFDDLLESVDFDDPAKAYPGPAGSRASARRSPPGSAPADSPVSRIPRPLTAWPMGAG